MSEQNLGEQDADAARGAAPYVFDTDQAADLAKAGADVLVPHMGTIGAQTTITLQDAAWSVQGMHDAVKKVNPDSGAADTSFSTAICIRRYRIKCPCADRSVHRSVKVSDRLALDLEEKPVGCLSGGEACSGEAQPELGNNRRQRKLYLSAVVSYGDDSVHGRVGAGHHEARPLVGAATPVVY